MRRVSIGFARRLALVVTGSAASLVLATAGAGTATAADSACTRVAAPGGSDSAAGTEAAPFLTAQKLVDALGPGDVGCLRQGTYHENVTVNRGGSGESSRVVLRSYAGERAKLSGRLYVTDNADYVTVEQLDLDGHDSPTCSSTSICHLPSPTVNGDHDLFQDLDVTNRHQGICFNLGNAGYGRAVSDVIRRNRIHDCGLLPANNHEHGIYLSYAESTQILENVIFDNADRGIQLYPDAQHTVVRGNVIDGNGEGIIFSGAGGTASNDNVVENNVITNSKIRHDVESYYPDVVGTGNVVRNNCVHGGAEGSIASSGGFTALANLTADPGYVDRAGKDFRLASDSPCAPLLAGASLPATPGGGVGKPQPPPQTGGGDTGSTPPPVQLTLSNATLRHAHHGHGWFLHIYGRVRGLRSTHRGIVQIRRGARWQPLAARQIHGYFRLLVKRRMRVLQGADLSRVRIVVPGVARSRAVPVRVR